MGAGGGVVVVGSRQVPEGVLDSCGQRLLLPKVCDDLKSGVCISAYSVPGETLLQLRHPQQIRLFKACDRQEALVGLLTYARQTQAVRYRPTSTNPPSPLRYGNKSLFSVDSSSNKPTPTKSPIKKISHS